MLFKTIKSERHISGHPFGFIYGKGFKVDQDWPSITCFIYDIGEIFMKKTISLISIIVILVTLVCVIFNTELWKKNNKIIDSDVIHYYAYLPALFIYRDLTLDFVNNYEGEHKFTIWYEKNDEGIKIIKTSMGLSILYLPFFIIGHLSAWLLGYDTGGYSEPYKFCLLFGSIIYLMIGLFFLRKILLKYFSDWVTSITLFAVVLGTNLFHYSVFEATMSHSYNFSLFAIFIYFTIKWHEKPDIKKSLLIGLLAGLITLIRPTNILIVLFFIFWQITSVSTFFNKIKLFQKKYYLIIIIACSSGLLFIPQLIYWYKITGHLFYYSYGSGEKFIFLKPQIVRGLFGYRKGWFLYTPMMLLAVLSIIFLIKKREAKNFLLPIIVFLIFNIYIILSWWCWWYGGSFGLRAFIDSYALLSIPLAVFLDWSFSKKNFIKIFSISLIAILCAHNIFETAQYYYGAIHWDSMTKEAYWHTFGKLHGNERYKNSMRRPDYEKAKLGVQAVIKRKLVKNIELEGLRIICDAEIISKENNKLLSTDSNFVFKGANALNTEYSFSGNNSLRLSGDNPYGYDITLQNIKAGDQFYCSVMRKNMHKNSFIVASEHDGKFYVSTSISEKINNTEWEKLSLVFRVPTDYKSDTLKFYVWNNDKKSDYFDDFTIIKKNALPSL